jgi:hypothetical protein
MAKNFTRRDFVRSALVAVAALPFVGTILSACTKKEGPPEGQTPLSENDPTAQALGYKEDASKVDTTRFPKKAGADGANQKCSNCAQYTALNGGWGKCNIFPQGPVAADGWCNSWVPKA